MAVFIVDFLYIFFKSEMRQWDPQNEMRQLDFVEMH